MLILAFYLLGGGINEIQRSGVVSNTSIYRYTLLTRAKLILILHQFVNSERNDIIIGTIEK